MAVLRYHVQGSASAPYLVTFEGEGQTLVAFCSCPAGRRRQAFCKHMAAALNADASKIVEPSDDLKALAGKATGSPLLEKAKSHTPSAQKPQPLTGVGSIKDISALTEPLLAGTELWSEYTTQQDGSEVLTVYMRKMYKNGNPYKKPTEIMSISYHPFIVGGFYDEDLNKVSPPKSKRPYRVGNSNYSNLEPAGAIFLEKLKKYLEQK